MQKKAFNVLVLGSSGVGKSTWINSISNYFKFDTFEEALQNPVECVIPTSFQIADEDYEMHTVTIGQSENENFELAHSTTQKPQVYAFQHTDFVINFIDVPGIGDTRGVDTDNTNVKAILDTVSLFNELHAICILLKATDSTMNIEYQYCLNELLMHLHKKAIENVFFVFTNSRASQFVPGNGAMVLNQYLKQLNRTKGITIETNKNVIYCIDNDAFRFQCAYSKIQEFRSTNSTPYKASWVKSQESTKRLFKRMATLNPHEVLYTLSINQARAAIISLIQPLATITGLIQANSANFETNMSEIVKQLQQNLTVSEYELQIEELSRPRTVCTAKKCVGVERCNGIVTTFYKQHCHDPCYLTGIPIKRFPEEGLRQCAAMRCCESCQICGCSYREHMHLDYNQKLVQRPTRFAQEMKKHGGNPKTAVKSQLDALKREQEVVSGTVVKFAGFLKKNSIFEHNNAFEERMKLEIQNAEVAADNGGDRSLVAKLQAILLDHIDMKQKMEAAIATAGNAQTINSMDVGRLRDELFDLPLHGEKIKELYDKNTTTNVERNQQHNFVYHHISLTPF